MFAGHNRGKYFMPGEGYVRGCKSGSTMESDKGKIHKCPFCSEFNGGAQEEKKKCNGCGRPWFNQRNGNIIYVGYIGDRK